MVSSKKISLSWRRFDGHRVVVRKSIFASILALTLLSSASSFSKKPDSVQDLAYGAALYELFQDKYFSALTELQVGETTGSIVHHADFAHVLRGGILLSYGMDREAEKLFSSLLQREDMESVSAENRARAWFYLGKLLYKKGSHRQALQQFERVDGALSRDLHGEFDFLYPSTLARIPGSEQQAGEDTAPAFKRRVPSDSVWRFYRDYNTLLLRLREPSAIDADRHDIATELVDLAQRVGRSKRQVNQRELVELRDRVLSTAGYLYLQIGDSTAAIRAFKRVRQEGAAVGQALLGYGWAALNAGDFRQALAPWQVLQKRSLFETSSLEALLAVPHVYEKLAARAEALAGYRDAIALLDDELIAIQQLELTLAAGDISLLLDTSDKQEAAWLDDIDYRQSGMEDAQRQRLQQLLASNGFQLLLNQRRDARWLQRNLQRWQLDVETMRFALDARQQRRDTALARQQAVHADDRIIAVQKRRDALAEQVRDATHDNTLQPLMNTAELQLQQRLSKARQLHERLKAKVGNSAESKTLDQSNALLPDRQQLERIEKELDLAQGMLHWQVQSSAVARQWQQRKVLQLIDTEIATMRSDALELDRRIEAQQAHSGLDNAIAEKHLRIEQQLQASEMLVTRVDRKIAQQLNTELNRLHGLVTDYLGQARLAQARLLDNLSLDGSPLSAETADSTNTSLAVPFNSAADVQ